MILGQISWLDCIAFLLFLAPQLLIHVGFFPTLSCGIQALPFLFIQLPFGFIKDHLFLSNASRSPFVQQASLFEDLVIRCVRYAFAYIPASVGRVFFSKQVALPFLRFRMLRHGYLESPIHWEEIGEEGFSGLWMISDPGQAPDIVVYYAHGGGFSMGSSYFYLEFLLAFLTLLKAQTQFQNPAILAVEYSLVPDASYPTQLHQIIAGYECAITKIKDASRIVVSGDSAGGTLILSLLLYLSSDSKSTQSHELNYIFPNFQLLQRRDTTKTMMPGMAALISPWTTLHSPAHHNTRSDYLDTHQLAHYARQYSPSAPSTPTSTSNTLHPSTTEQNHALISPGTCTSLSWWRRASPTHGFFITYGREEVFAPEIRTWIHRLQDAKVDVGSWEEPGGIHAWPVASLFLSGSKEERLTGLKGIVRRIGERVGR